MAYFAERVLEKHILTDSDGHDYTFRVKEQIDLKNDKVKITFYIETKEQSKIKISDLVVNEEEFADETIEDPFGENSFFTEEYSIDEYEVIIGKSRKSFDIRFKLYCNYATLLFWWKENAEFSMQFQTDYYDLMPPAVENINVKCGLLGENIFASFLVETLLGENEIEKAIFTLRGLSLEQYSLRGSDSYNSGATSTSGKKLHSGLYQLNYCVDVNKTHQNISIDLNSKDNLEPLTPGVTYEYEIAVNIKNGKVTTLTGSFTPPIALTEIQVTESVQLTLGEKGFIDCTIEPSEAYETGVIFSSSDPSIATVDENGVVTAVSDGFCTVTTKTVGLTTNDTSSYLTAETFVEVYDLSRFPTLDLLEEYLTAAIISKIIAAAKFIRYSFEERGIALDGYIAVSCQGKTHPVLEIFPLLLNIESNIYLLLSTAKNEGIEILTLSDNSLKLSNNSSTWRMVINIWISFLIELNSKINGG